MHGEKIDRILQPKQVPLDFLHGGSVKDYQIAGSSALLLDSEWAVRKRFAWSHTFFVGPPPPPNIRLPPTPAKKKYAGAIRACALSFCPYLLSTFVEGESVGQRSSADDLKYPVTHF